MKERQPSAYGILVKLLVCFNLEKKGGCGICNAAPHRLCSHCPQNPCSTSYVSKLVSLLPEGSSAPSLSGQFSLCHRSLGSTTKPKRTTQASRPFCAWRRGLAGLCPLLQQVSSPVLSSHRSLLLSFLPSMWLHPHLLVPTSGWPQPPSLGLTIICCSLLPSFICVPSSGRDEEVGGHYNRGHLLPPHPIPSVTVGEACITCESVLLQGMGISLPLSLTIRGLGNMTSREIKVILPPYSALQKSPQESGVGPQTSRRL